MTDEPGAVAELVGRLVGEGTLTGASLSRPRRSDPSRPSRVTVAPVMLGGSLRYRFTTHQASRTSDENLPPDAAADRLVHLLGSEFRQGVLQSTEADWQVLAGGSGATRRSCADRRPGRRSRSVTTASSNGCCRRECRCRFSSSSA